MSGSMAGRRYLLRGQVVTLITGFCARRRDLPATPPWLEWMSSPKAAPRNVAVRYEDGTTLVRGFRGLRRWSA